jgi:multicomponent Na+:H+ antiporter subunit E
LARGALLLGLWVVLVGPMPLDLAVGVATAAAAVWVSLRLLPPARTRFRVAVLPRLALRFLSRSVLAGIDVARRVFDPRLPLRPGYVRYAVGFRPGNGRNAFAALTSLLPGTVPAGGEDASLLYHCLDVGQPVAEDLAAEEAALRRALREEPA